MGVTSPTTHFVAAFGFDGELVGLARRNTSELSPKWIEKCEQLLIQEGETFKASFGKTLEHIEVHLASESGLGLGTFYVNGHVFLSTAYLTGKNRDEEGKVIGMFIESLRRVERVRLANGSEPFETMRTLRERPLHIAVFWADPAISAQDEELAKELSMHFAAAYFKRTV